MPVLTGAHASPSVASQPIWVPVPPVGVALGPQSSPSLSGETHLPVNSKRCLPCAAGFFMVSITHVCPMRQLV